MVRLPSKTQSSVFGNKNTRKTATFVHPIISTAPVKIPTLIPTLDKNKDIDASHFSSLASSHPAHKAHEFQIKPRRNISENMTRMRDLHA